MTIGRSMVFVLCISTKLYLPNVFSVLDTLLTARPVSVASSVTDCGCWSAMTFNNCWFSFDSTLATDFSESNQISTGKSGSGVWPLMPITQRDCFAFFITLLRLFACTLYLPSSLTKGHCQRKRKTAFKQSKDCTLIHNPSILSTTDNIARIFSV